MNYELKNWKQDLAEYGALHNEDCCVNFEDSNACDVGTGAVECCENMKMAAAHYQEYATRLVEYMSHDITFKDEEQRKAAVQMYLEELDLV